MVFAGSDILQADDGGIYRLVNPRGLAGTATVWKSVLGNLRNSEIISVALDNRNNDAPADDIILAGVFDNGSNERSATGQWAQILGGDGMITQAFDAGTPIHYFANQYNVGTRVGQMAIPTIEGAPLNTFLTRQYDPTLPFKVAYQLHASDPNRILVGSEERLYESINGGES